MDKKITQDPGFYRDLINEIWSQVSEAPQRGAEVSCILGTTLKRKDPDTHDIFDVDIVIDYDATMTDPGYRGSRDEPGYGPEWEFTITKIDLDLGDHHTPSDLAEVGGPLTPKEKATIEQWFYHNQERATEIASNNYEPNGY